jgi:hypothetical protein
VIIPQQCKHVEFLRNHPGIKRISYKKMTESAEEFWKVFDARQSAKGRPAAPVPLQNR